MSSTESISPAAVPSLTLGIDIGGTFTDLALVDRERRVTVRHKLLTTVEPEEAVLKGADELVANAGYRYAQLGSVQYSTTVAANAIIARQGARTGLLCTRGFRDVLANRKEERYDLYDLLAPFPEPLVPRRCRLGIAERTAFDGTILAAPRRSDVEQARSLLRAERVESVAIAFLHAYANRSNERQVGAWLQELEPTWHVSLSSDVDSQIGEYERTSTTVINAYVQPAIADHLATLEAAFRKRGLTAPFYVVTSSGGVVNSPVAQRVPARLVESGPAAGVVASNVFLEVARELHRGSAGLLAFDIGGTTAKSCFTADVELPTVDELEVARLAQHKKGSGLLIRTPSVDLLEIGAGGGSIAEVDRMGMLQVGPRSAGSHPGPICYGLGGTQPTVTDADLVLGYLRPGGLLAGRVRISVENAMQAYESLGRHFGKSAVATAWAVIEVVTE
jgi:5-oxoprolinase (ATP-hydrolysing)/N-methylhydantoinase A